MHHGLKVLAILWIAILVVSHTGLAHDALSAENAVVILQSERPLLILDPSGQAARWLQGHLKAQGTNFEVVPMHSDRSALFI